jgi:murein DD-endopeptidase MepM/ murein hydrolase activator NlpD
MASASAPNPVISATPPSTGNAIDELTARRLTLPVDKADVDRWKGMFGEGRDAGKRPHEAVDVLAPRNTPIHAVEDGVVAKLFYSKAGGNTIYQFDPDGRFCYYYAHLQQYAPGLEEGQRIKRDQIIGYVGTSGNAPPDTPHLHFAIFALDEKKHWWQGRPLDPYLVFEDARGH